MSGRSIARAAAVLLRSLREVATGNGFEGREQIAASRISSLLRSDDLRSVSDRCGWVSILQAGNLPEAEPE